MKRTSVVHLTNKSSFLNVAIIIIICISLIMSISCEKEDINENKDFNQKLNVTKLIVLKDSIIQSEYYYSNKKPIKIIYHKNNIFSDSILYFYDNEKIDYIEEYDKKGDKTIRKFTYNGNNQLINFGYSYIDNLNFYYDSEGRINVIDFQDLDGSNVTINLKYDNNDNILSEYSYSDHGYSIDTSKYDNKNNPFHFFWHFNNLTTNLSPNNVIWSKYYMVEYLYAWEAPVNPYDTIYVDYEWDFIYEYDSLDNPVSKTIYNKNNDRTTKYQFVYEEIEMTFTNEARIPK